MGQSSEVLCAGIIVADHGQAARIGAVRLLSQINERWRRRKGRVWIDAGVVVTADAAGRERVNQLGIRPNIQARAHFLSKIYAQRLLVVNVVEYQTAIVLDQA